MEPNASQDRDLIAELRPHINAAIKVSPITCAELRFDDILEMVLEYGLDPETRIKNFNKLREPVDRVYSRAMKRHRQDPNMKESMDRMSAAIVDPATSLSKVHAIMNYLYAQCGIAEIIRDCEEVAVAYSAALRYAWANATVLTRFIKREAELEYMLLTGVIESNNNSFVSTSVTRSPGHSSRPILYRITVTPGYRKNAFVLMYTSVFEYERREVLRGYKQYYLLEDEVRFRNRTSIEPGTIEIVFYDDNIPETTKKALEQKYAPLGSVTFERWKTS